MSVYSNTDGTGLELIGDIEWRDESYSFDMTAVWRDTDGSLYWADDAGCSCPSPFGDFYSREDLTTGSLAELTAHLQDRLKTSVKSSWNDPEAQVADILHRIAG